MCSYAAFPAVIWASSTDVSNEHFGLTCERLEKPLPGTSAARWYDFWKITRLIPEIPLG